jgi:hypothetical protein
MNVVQAKFGGARANQAGGGGSLARTAISRGPIPWDTVRGAATTTVVGAVRPLAVANVQIVHATQSLTGVRLSGPAGELPPPPWQMTAVALVLAWLTARLMLQPARNAWRTMM